MGQGQARGPSALQTLHQAEAMEQPTANTRVPGGAGGQRFHRHPTPIAATGGQSRRQGGRLRLHDNAVTPHAAATTAANGGIQRHGAPQSSHNQDDTRRNAGAPRCNPAAADARTATSCRAARKTSRHTSHMKCCVQEVFPAGSSWKEMTNSVPESSYLFTFIHAFLVSTRCQSGMSSGFLGAPRPFLNHHSLSKNGGEI